VELFSQTSEIWLGIWQQTSPTPIANVEDFFVENMTI
jgi:hypothetical protein